MGRIVKAVGGGLGAPIGPHTGPHQATVGDQARAAEGDARDAGLAQVTALLVSAHLTAQAELAAAKDVAWALARKMAEKIIGRAVELDASVVGELVGQAMAASRARGGALVLRVHPDDLSAVEQTRPQWLHRLSTRESGAPFVQLVADSCVGRYGCVIETAVGRLDARLQTQLDALERAVRGHG